MSDNHQSQWSLLKKNNFAPLFWTQFLGAFNDNLYKNALIFLLTFGTLVMPGSMMPEIAVQISAGLFILPFFLFSAWAGELADCSEKSQLIRYLKVWEIGIAIIGTIGLFSQNVYCMWAALFGLGVQATFFGPIKYSILPQHLKDSELIGGNALIESGTFIAILLGTILGGVLISMEGGSKWVSLGCVLVAVMGYMASRKIPQAQAVAPDLKVNWNIIEPSIKSIKLAREVRSVFLSILGISWFWFFGASLLAQFPSLVKDVVGGTEIIVTLFLAIFSVGTGVGSMLCEKMSGKKVEIGLVPFGAFGTSVFAYALYHAFSNFKPLNHGDVMQFIHATGSYEIMTYLFFMSMFGGFFIVPLYALIQTRSKESVRSRIIAANNIINALFMVASAVFAVVMFSLGYTVTQLILALAVLNALVAIYIFTIVPEFLLRFLVWIVMSTFYRTKKINLDNIPDEGAAIIVCNHVSFLDGLMIFGSCSRPVKFVMYYKIFNIPLFKYLFKAGGAIPIASKKEAPEVLEAAYKKINDYLEASEIVVIFPEGRITNTGDMSEFRPGIMKTLSQLPVPVIPTALSGLWGSMYSRKDKGVLRYFPKAFFSHKVTFTVGAPIAAKDVNMQLLYDQVSALRGDNK